MFGHRTLSRELADRQRMQVEQVGPFSPRNYWEIWWTFHHPDWRPLSPTPGLSLSDPKFVIKDNLQGPNKWFQGILENAVFRNKWQENVKRFELSMEVHGVVGLGFSTMADGNLRVESPQGKLLGAPKRVFIGSPHKTLQKNKQIALFEFHFADIQIYSPRSQYAEIIRRRIMSSQFMATSAEVTPKGSLVRESYPKWP